MLSKRSPTTRRAVIAAGIVVPALVLWVGFMGCEKPPQMGADEEVFKTVDALFTAVTARDEQLLGQCEERLHALKDAGRLPSESSDYLDDVIKKAHRGRWESAAEKLHRFMTAQRREGVQDPRTRKQDQGRSSSVKN